MGRGLPARGLAAGRQQALRVLCLSAALLAALPGPAAARPQTVLWVWDRPQRLADYPAGVGLAYLHATVRLSGPTAEVRLRQWPLKPPPGAFLMPVVHVSFDNLQPAPLDDTQQARIEAALRHAARHSRSGWVQLDLEARFSQRAAYARLLQRLQPLRHAATPQRPAVRLSITALASWCMDDAWLPAGLVDEVVPMYFRLGPDGPAIRERLQRDRQAPVPACRSAAGFMQGEPVVALQGLQRRYFFHPAAWTAADVAALPPAGVPTAAPTPP